MSSETDRAIREAQRAVAGPFDNLVENLADRIGVRANVHAVFGAPIVQEGVTVIPVAKVRWGFGGGGGRGTADKAESVDAGEGGGGGGGVIASPLGYIEVRDGGAAFHRIRDIASYVPVMLAGAVSFWLISRGVKTIFR